MFLTIFAVSMRLRPAGHWRKLWSAQRRGPRARACPPCHWREHAEHAEHACVWERARTHGSWSEAAIRGAQDGPQLCRNDVFEPTETLPLTGGSAKHVFERSFRHFMLISSRWPKMAQKSQKSWPAQCFYSFLDVWRACLHCLPCV